MENFPSQCRYKTGVRKNPSGTSSVAPGGGAFSAISCKIFLLMVGHLFTFLKAIENQSPSISRGGGVGVYFDWCIVPEDALSVWANFCKHSLFVFELSKIGSFKFPPPSG